MWNLINNAVLLRAADRFNPYMGYFWIVIAIIFLFAELHTPGLFFFISFAFGACCAAVLAFLGYSLIVQCVAGLIVSIVAFGIMRKYLKHKKLSEVSYDDAPTNIYGLIGRSGVVVQQITNNKAGRVRIGGELWRARVEDDAVLHEGTVVVVLRIEGNTVIVDVRASVDGFNS